MSAGLLVFAIFYTIYRVASYLEEIQDFKLEYHEKYGEWPSKQLIKDIFW